MSKRALVLFAGGGGVDIALHNLGYEVTGIEYDADIAAVAQSNGLSTLTANVLDIDYSRYTDCELLHASPPCPNFSNAKAGAAETDLDRQLAAAISCAIHTIKPRYFSLENVYRYRVSDSWSTIAMALHTLGYGIGAWHLNAADYGVPQTRSRMIVLARRDGRKILEPTPTHAKEPKSQLSLFDSPLKRWESWYSAVENILHTCETAHHRKGVPCEHDPEGRECRDSRHCWGHFAPWQYRRLPQDFVYAADFAPHTQANSNTDGRYGDEPMTTLGATKWPNKAFVLGNGQRSAAKPDTLPVDTLTANRNQSNIKAFVMNAGNVNGNEKKKYRLDDQPSKTVCATDSGRIRAFVVDGQTGSSGTTVTIRDEQDPIYTMQSSQNKRMPKAYTNGRVILMSARCLARFQTFPDWYKLPENKTLACRIIGNAYPTLLAEKVIGSLIDRR